VLFPFERFLKQAASMDGCERVRLLDYTCHVGAILDLLHPHVSQFMFDALHLALSTHLTRSAAALCTVR